jgi:hypothetical protein
MNDRQLDILIDEDRPKVWKRSRKGNLYRRLNDLTLTVFRLDSGAYGWAIATPDEVRFSDGHFDSEDGALKDVCREVENEA